MCSKINDNNKSDIIWAICSLLIYIFGISGAALVDDIGGENSNLSASGWIFGIIWPIIYIDQFIWHFYYIYQNIKQPSISQSGEYSSYLMYSTSTIKGKLFFICFILSNLLQFGWYASVGQKQYLLAAIIIFFYCLAIIGTNIFPHKYFYDITTNNISPQRIPSKIAYILFYLNGIQIYATWLVLANMISWSSQLLIVIDDDKETPALIFECVLIVILFIYLYLDLFKFRAYLKYTYISYIVVIAASFAVLTNGGFDFNLVSQIIVLILAVFMIIMLVVKIVFIGFKSEYESVSMKSSSDSDQQKLNEKDVDTNAQV